MIDALTRLETLIEARLAVADAKASYTARLAAEGLPQIAQKLGEEAVETVIAALAEDDAHLVAEAADLVFHLTLLLHKRNLGWRDLFAELERREGVSGIDEKAQRNA